MMHYDHATLRIGDKTIPVANVRYVQDDGRRESYIMGTTDKPLEITWTTTLSRESFDDFMLLTEPEVNAAVRQVITDPSRRRMHAEFLASFGVPGANALVVGRHRTECAKRKAMRRLLQRARVWNWNGRE